MKIIIALITLLIPLVLHADEPPLRIAVTSFDAPYVMQGNNQQFYGFDISMLNYVCKTLQRHCIFLPMTLSEIYPAIMNKRVDLAASAIIISPEKVKYVLMSIPYMLSNGQYIGTNNAKDQPLDVKTLQKKRIGVIKHSSFENYLYTLGLSTFNVVGFDTHNQIIDALNAHEIDLGLCDSHIAAYWKIYSAGTLYAVGSPFPIGNGLGIIANLDSQALIAAVNNALVEYESSGQFKHDYQLYLESF